MKINGVLDVYEIDEGVAVVEKYMGCDQGSARSRTKMGSW
jgi:hypothetical protein